VQSPGRFAVVLTTLGSLAAGPSAAAPSAADDEVRIAGEVVRSQARLVRGGGDIATESVVRTAEGEVTVRQLGGTVDGVAMLLSHAPPLLAVGDQVELRAATARDRRGRASLVVRAVDRLAEAPVADRTTSADFVRTVNARGGALYWDSSCVFIAHDGIGTSHIAGDGELAVIDQVFARWRSDTAACSYLTFELEGARQVEVGNDGVNLIRFREASWCRPATDDDPGECYPPDAAGLTTLWFINDSGSAQNGKILDADIELNAVHFTLAVDGETTRPGGGCIADLANTLTHEVGHLVGLDHTCWNGVGTQPRDDSGALAPSCDGPLSDEAQEATMFAYQDCGETKKASPEPDDINGVCAIYPLASDPGECRRAGLDPAGCCAVAGRRPLPLGALPLLMSVFFLVARLRRR
jgi:hypothetical protein